MSVEGMNIYQRLNAVRKAVAYIKKDTEVKEGFSYKAVSHDAVTAATRGAFIDAGVLIVPSQTAGSVIDTGNVTAKGRKWIRLEAEYDIAFINIDKPEDRLVVHLQSHAEDTGDKAPGKCLSYATKTATLKVLYMESGDGDESRASDKIPAPYTDDQKEWFDALLEGGDALGLHIFSMRVGKETFIALANSFEKGEKTKKKSLLRSLEGEGVSAFNDLLASLGGNDPVAVSEALAGVTEKGMQLVHWKLNAEQRKALDEMQSEAA